MVEEIIEGGTMRKYDDTKIVFTGELFEMIEDIGKTLNILCKDRLAWDEQGILQKLQRKIRYINEQNSYEEKDK